MKGSKIRVAFSLSMPHFQPFHAQFPTLPSSKFIEQNHQEPHEIRLRKLKFKETTGAE